MLSHRSSDVMLEFDFWPKILEQSEVKGYDTSVAKIQEPNKLFEIRTYNLKVSSSE